MFIYLFVYLLDIYSIPLPRGQHAARKETRRKELRKTGSGQRVKPSTPTQAIDAHMGEEEKNRKQKQERNKETRSERQTMLPGPFCRLLRPTWIIRWEYSETPTPAPADGGKIKVEQGNKRRK